MRIYQYQTDCLAHIPGMPAAGDWVVQEKDDHGYWRNVGGPFHRKDQAEKALTS